MAFIPPSNEVTTEIPQNEQSITNETIINEPGTNEPTNS